MDVYSLPRDRAGNYIYQDRFRTYRISMYKELIKLRKNPGSTDSVPYLDGTFYLDKIILNIGPWYNVDHWQISGNTPLRIYYQENAERTIALNLWACSGVENPCLDPANHVKNVVIKIGKVIETPIYEFPMSVPFIVYTQPDQSQETDASVLIHRAEIIN